MHPNHPRRARGLALFLVALVAALAAVPATAGAAGVVKPQLLSPKRGAVLAVGTQPTFKVKDLGRPYGGSVYISIATSRHVDRRGRLVDTGDGGTFSKMVRKKNNRWTYTPPNYTFDTWFMNKPGTYYWQASHTDPQCRVIGCTVLSRVRTFKVG